MDTLISNVTIVTMNERMEVLFGGYIGITGGNISYIGKTAPTEQPATIVDGTGMVAIPGLVNCHTHLATTGLRSLLDDLPRRESLEQLLKLEAKMDTKTARASVLMGIAECLRFGITSVSDLYYYPDATAEAIAETGMKANLALSAYRFEDDSQDFDFETDAQCQEVCRVADKWNGYDAGRIRIDAGIYAEYTSNRQLWEGLAAYAAEKELGFQLHLAETQEEADSCQDRTGLGPAELLSCHRVLNVPVTATTCACLSPEEQVLLGKKKASAVAMPLASHKAGLPATPIRDCVKAGMNVALGTGGAVDCGNMDLFEVMRYAACDGMPASAVLMMATVCGARAQGRAGECGMLKEGMNADIVLVDFSAPHLMPCHNVVNGLVYSAKGGDVAMTMVRGKVLYQNGRFPTMDLKAVVESLTGYTIPRLLNESKE